MIRSFIATAALAGALLIPSAAHAQTATRYFDSDGHYQGSSTTTSGQFMVGGDQLTVVGDNPRVTRYYDADGNFAGYANTSDGVTYLN